MVARLCILSYNIRYNNPADGANAWPHRQTQVAALLQKYQPDLIGLQEVLHEQLTTLAALLPAYSWVGVGRDDGVAAGEYAPIFYRPDRLVLQESGHFWLSQSPEQIGSFGWDAACVRVATWARFTDTATGAQFIHLNTHLDHSGLVAQIESAKLLQTFLAHQAPTIPALITGDFNCTPDSAPYQALTTAAQAAGTAFHDALTQSVTPHEGPTATFTTNFADPLQEKIDYIFLRTRKDAATTFTVQRHVILADQQNGCYPSDHLPVWAELSVSVAPLQEEQ
jgi:endonuclease/exonuclease/phosphatase family metal-dependent hydrolase